MRIFLLVILFFPFQLSACLVAHIFKIYPVGLQNDTIWTVDFHINRSDAFPLIDDSLYLADLKQSLQFKSTKTSLTMWMLKSYITAYNKQQEVLFVKAMDSTFFFKNSYMEELQYMHSKALDVITQMNPELRLFKFESISTCNRGHICKNIELKDDFFIYANAKYPIKIVNDSLYHGWYIDSPYHEIITSLPLPGIQTLVKYTANKSELILVHIQFGEKLVAAKRKTPEFNSIKKVYEEAILHHGNGYDLFFVQAINKQN